MVLSTLVGLEPPDWDFEGIILAGCVVIFSAKTSGYSDQARVKVRSWETALQNGRIRDMLTS